MSKQRQTLIGDLLFLAAVIATCVFLYNDAKHRPRVERIEFSRPITE